MRDAIYLPIAGGIISGVGGIVTRMILLEGVKPQYAVILPGVHAEAIITHPFNVSHGARVEIATCIFESLPPALRCAATFADLLPDHLENGVV